MALPINISELINGQTVEWERIEFKKGWNPLDTIQSIAAFANDINNWGGGYIVLGIEDKDGRPVLPPAGLEQGQLDQIQKDLMDLCCQLRPQYFPIAEPVIVEGRHVLVIWVPGGELRPYKAPDRTSRTEKQYRYYVRHFSSTKQASTQEERDLLAMSAHIPFDDQAQPNAEIGDIKLGLLQEHLAKVGSDLALQAATIAFPDLCRRMNVVTGPDEYLKPKNIGLLMFNENPKQFFPCAQIDLVQFKDEVGDSFTEKVFVGPIQQQLQDALVYIKNTIVAEKVQKIEGRAEAQRVFNYPFEAIEEALVNTIYHRSYEDDSPIEIRVLPNVIEMISYPGPLPPITKAKLEAGDIVARKYRNRRIGDFLKELHLTEGRGTGIPKIKRSMKLNGSPEPIFETDDGLSYFRVKLPIHPSWAGQVTAQVTAQVTINVDNQVLAYCLRPKKRLEIMQELGLFNNQANFTKYAGHLISQGYLELTVPDKPKSRFQQYRTTAKGVAYLDGRPLRSNTSNTDQASLGL